MPTDHNETSSRGAGLEPLDQAVLQSALMRVVSFAREWHGQPGRSIETLPEAVGAELRFQALPAPTSILGLSVKIAQDPPLMILTEDLTRRPGYKQLTICHEAFHIVAGFNGIAACDTRWRSDPMERLAWLGPALCMVPEVVVTEWIADGFQTMAAAARHGVHPSFAAQRVAITVVEGTAPGDPARAMAFLDASAYALCAWTMMVDGLVPPSANLFDMWPYPAPSRSPADNRA